MKFLIVSDSHGSTKELFDLKKRHFEEVEAFFHCGDSELQQENETIEGMHIVRGNCDGEHAFPDEICKAYGKAIFYVAHGHLHQVKSTLLNIQYRAAEYGANIVCFGHSHIAGAEYIDGMLYVNPGSILLPRMRKEQTYAIIEIINTEAKVTFYDKAGTELPALGMTCELLS
ncbi:YfcE family phosphodiesterase [Bacillus lacus]|uniref:Phosphoesterase n=1 Tax=Metabacillus lacus TaxID=1983721 RepID=A0A7X2IY56_9BACI|nr:YfcE family phosphodiesterase [Metabacillus lacus]